MKTVTTKGCKKWYELGIHPYPICTNRAKHPIHMCSGGSIITTDMRETEPAGEMGVFGLNAKDWALYKANETDVEIELE